MSSPPPANRPPAPQRDRSRNILIYAFVISAALHLAVGPFVKFERAADVPDEVHTLVVEKMPTPPPTPKPTPKPTPTPPPTPPPKQQTPAPKQPPKIKINTLTTTSKSTGETTEEANTHTTGSTQGNPLGVPSGVPSAPPVTAPPATPAPPTPTPTPVPTPTPLACKAPNVPPRVVSASPVDTPPIAQQQGITGEVQVIVDLDENSKQVSPPKIFKSVSRLLEKAAIDSAAHSRFQTEIAACKPKASKYIYIVDFTSQ